MPNSNPQPFSSQDLSGRSAVATIEAERSALQIKLIHDPWSLTHQERLELRASLAREQVQWLRRIEGLIEPPAIDDAFPAFLLATKPFAHLAHAVSDAGDRSALGTGATDALQRFVDRYRSFLSDAPN
jgi:hypothetical protein